MVRSRASGRRDGTVDVYSSFHSYFISLPSSSFMSSFAAGQQITFSRSETRPRQPMSQSHSYSLDTLPALSSVKTRLSPALFTHVGDDSRNSGKLRGTATGGSLLLDEARGGGAEGKTPAEERACRSEDAGKLAATGGGGGSSAVLRPDLLLAKESTEAGSRVQKAHGVAVHYASRKLPSRSIAVESTGGPGDTASNRGSTQSNNTRMPILRTTSTARKVPRAGEALQAPPTVKFQPAPGPGVKDAQVAAAGANSHSTKGTFSATEVKDVGRVSSGVFNPYKSTMRGTATRDPAAGRVFAGVSNPYHPMGAIYRDPSRSVPVQLVPTSTSKTEYCPSEDPKALLESSQTPSDVGGSSDGSHMTPPEVRFETARHQLYKKTRSGTMGGGGRGRGRGRGGGRGAGRGGKRGSTAPRPAQDALVGVWRTESAKMKGTRGTR